MKEEERNEPRFTLLPLCSFLLLHSFLTTPLCSFIRLVCNGLKRWRKHETSRIKETKNVVKGVVNGVCWVKKKERRAFISFLCPFLFSSATTQHTTEQSRPVKGILGLCSCCVLCYRFIVMDWAKWGKHEWTGNKDHTTATKGNERNKKKTNEKSTQWREHAFGPFHLSLFI